SIRTRSTNSSTSTSFRIARPDTCLSSTEATEDTEKHGGSLRRLPGLGDLWPRSRAKSVRPHCDFVERGPSTAQTVPQTAGIHLSNLRASSVPSVSSVLERQVLTL